MNTPETNNDPPFVAMALLAQIAISSYLERNPIERRTSLGGRRMVNYIEEGISSIRPEFSGSNEAGLRAAAAQWADEEAVRKYIERIISRLRTMETQEPHHFSLLQESTSTHTECDDERWLNCLLDAAEDKNSASEEISHMLIEVLRPLLREEGDGPRE